MVYPEYLKIVVMDFFLFRVCSLERLPRLHVSPLVLTFEFSRVLLAVESLLFLVDSETADDRHDLLKRLFSIGAKMRPWRLSLAAVVMDLVFSSI